MFTYTPKGVCSREMSFDIVDGKIRNVAFKGGCQGNLAAIAKLVDGKDAKTIAIMFLNHKCGSRNTSCMGEFARFILKSLKERSE